MSLSYINEETGTLSIWKQAEVEELIDFWIKRRDFEQRPTLVIYMGEEITVIQYNRREIGVELKGRVDPVELEAVRQTLIEFFTFLLMELHQPSVTVHYTFQDVVQPTLKLNIKE